MVGQHEAMLIATFIDVGWNQLIWKTSIHKRIWFNGFSHTITLFSRSAQFNNNNDNNNSNSSNNISFSAAVKK